jgi:2-polyprenyl-6-methoxyphenol hydroxylase-like FAD-dependent oxidoreductase
VAGSTAAAMLGRAGISAILIDPHPVHPSDFRVEKLSGRDQLERFRKTGLAEMILRAATHDGENWIARFGYLLDKRPSQQYGLSYDALVNAIRAASACVTSSGLRRLRNRLDAGPKFRTQSSSSSSSSSLSPSA